jgi:hypothetical protein
MNSQLQDQILTGIAKEMQTDIDRGVLWGMLQSMGWTRVMLDRLQDNKHAVDITYWLEENIKNPFERNGRDFLFMVILRWS